MVVSETAEKTFVREIRERALNDLPAGELIIEVKYSSLQLQRCVVGYRQQGRDAKVSAHAGHRCGGHRRGFDDQNVFGRRSGDGHRFRSRHEYLRAASASTSACRRFGRSICRKGLSLKDSMGYGTAGLTAALCIIRLMASGLTKDSGEVLVTGATGGVGSVARRDSRQARLQRRRGDRESERA